ncbi:hypothetical protein JK358_35720 [Nocardia sp. 2]|uniref:Uncharacterized protein n=1 Tax=Nocardia acididurans TaxID=2802282 RepID=A0ABS1MJB1_9NOCA|nr:hypothetical protein [Nocardia acididurans]MBL1079764.1 hypothetical protein [Nocardia acididurans]
MSWPFEDPIAVGEDVEVVRWRSRAAAEHLWNFAVGRGLGFDLSCWSESDLRDFEVVTEALSAYWHSEVDRLLQRVRDRTDEAVAR